MFATCRCNNAKQGPHAAFNAYKEFVKKDTTALFLAAALEHFQLTNLEGNNNNFEIVNKGKGNQSI